MVLFLLWLTSEISNIIFPFQRSNGSWTGSIWSKRAPLHCSSQVWWTLAQIHNIFKSVSISLREFDRADLMRIWSCQLRWLPSYLTERKNSNFKVIPEILEPLRWFHSFSYSWHSLIRSSRGIGFSSNKGAYRIMEHVVYESLSSALIFQFDRK